MSEEDETFMPRTRVGHLECRSCGWTDEAREVKIEPDLIEEDEKELDDFVDQVCSQLGITGVHPFVEEALKARLRRRIARLDADERIRLLMHLT